jgi:hypothetical protein
MPATLYFIDKTYFHSELFLPNLTGTGDLVTDQQTLLDYFIQKYEPELLTGMFGNLYLSMAAALQDPVYCGVYVQIFAQIRNTTLKTSPIANYVYFHFQRNALTNSLMPGEAAAKFENANGVSPEYKMQRAWMEMERQLDDVIEWLGDNNTLLNLNWTLPSDYYDLFNGVNVFNI